MNFKIKTPPSSPAKRTVELEQDTLMHAMLNGLDGDKTTLRLIVGRVEISLYV